MGALVKICGLQTPQDIYSVVASGGRYGGFVFFEGSPRHITLPVARALRGHIPQSLETVALMVEPTDEALDQVCEALGPDWVQLHGKETPARVQAIKARVKRPVLKALGVKKRTDLAKIDAYTGAADKILLDAKPSSDMALPGGNGLAFDWKILSDFSMPLPWMLAGGLDLDNVREAICQTGALEVDVSSGVEDKLGQKNHNKIAAFVANASGGMDVG